MKNTTSLQLHKNLSSMLNEKKIPQQHNPQEAPQRKLIKDIDFDCQSLKVYLSTSRGEIVTRESYIRALELIDKYKEIKDKRQQENKTSRKQYIKKYIGVFNLIKSQVGVLKNNKSCYCTKTQLDQLAKHYDISFPNTDSDDNITKCEFFMNCNDTKIRQDYSNANGESNASRVTLDDNFDDDDDEMEVVEKETQKETQPKNSKKKENWRN